MGLDLQYCVLLFICVECAFCTYVRAEEPSQRYSSRPTSRKSEKNRLLESAYRHRQAQRTMLKHEKYCDESISSELQGRLIPLC